MSSTHIFVVRCITDCGENVSFTVHNTIKGAIKSAAKYIKNNIVYNYEMLGYIKILKKLEVKKHNIKKENTIYFL